MSKTKQLLDLLAKRSDNNSDYTLGYLTGVLQSLEQDGSPEVEQMFDREIKNLKGLMGQH